MVSISKRNKRTSLHQKYKVAKKVRQHNKKAKQVAKKQKPKKEKMTEIPNNVPFKAEIINSMEIAKQQEKDHNKKRAVALSKLRYKPAVDEHEELKKRLSIDHTAAIIEDIKKTIDLSTIVIEVLDARDPMGTRCLEIENEIKLKNKTLVFALNKIDLVPADNLRKWVAFLAKEAPVFPLCCKLNKAKSVGDKIQVVQGVPQLMTYLKAVPAGPERVLVAVVGVARTGKSSLVDGLKGRRVCGAGILRQTQRVDLNAVLTVAHAPTIVLASGNSEVELALRGCIQAEKVKEPSAVAAAIFDRVGGERLQSIYCLRECKGFEGLLAEVGARHCRLKKGGEVDGRAASRRLVADWQNGRVSHCVAVSGEGDMTIEVVACMPKGADVAVVEGTGPLRGLLEFEEIDESEEEDSEDEGCCQGECDDDECCEGEGEEVCSEDDNDEVMDE